VLEVSAQRTPDDLLVIGEASGDLTFPKALGLGFAQALALIPGVSRSGISISAGLFAGLDRESAARFSFLMATPITAAAAAYEGFKLIRGEIGVAVEWLPLIAGMVAALLSGLLAISVLLRFLRTRSLNIFVAYRIVLAAVVLVVFLR
jgi:undecaprenyl-diphosphatase